jgi:hypothetical protein
VQLVPDIDVRAEQLRQSLHRRGWTSLKLKPMWSKLKIVLNCIGIICCFIVLCVQRELKAKVLQIPSKFSSY